MASKAARSVSTPGGAPRSPERSARASSSSSAGTRTMCRGSASRSSCASITTRCAWPPIRPCARRRRACATAPASAPSRCTSVGAWSVSGTRSVRRYVGASRPARASRRWIVRAASSTRRDRPLPAGPTTRTHSRASIALTRRSTARSMPTSAGRVAVARARWRVVPPVSARRTSSVSRGRSAMRSESIARVASARGAGNQAGSVQAWSSGGAPLAHATIVAPSA